MALKKPLKEIPIAQLDVGMFVVRMDIAWIDSPFMSNSVKIKKKSDIVKLKAAGAKLVTIDPNKGVDVAVESSQAAATEQTAAPESETQEKADVKSVNENEPDRTSLKKEMSAALELRSYINKAVSSMQEALAGNRAIQVEALHPLIDQTLASLERNSDALMSLAHMSRRAQKLADHSFSTYCLAMNLARFLDIDETSLRHLGTAALLHEAGWLNIPLQLMGKRTRYTPQEERLIQRHPEIALKKLASSALPDLVTRIIKEHHERENGSGYPAGLSADNIHPLSKILAVADTYDELIHMLRDAPSLLPTAAMRQLFIDAKKGLYDQKVVESLVALLGIYPISSAVLLKNGEKGVVVEVPHNQHLFPVIEIKYDADGAPLKPPRLCDLAEMQRLGTPVEILTVLDPSKPEDDPCRLLELDVM